MTDAETVLEYWDALGVTGGAGILVDLGVEVGQGGQVNLRHLTGLLEDEIQQSQDIARLAAAASYDLFRDDCAVWFDPVVPKQGRVKKVQIRKLALVERNL